MGQLYFTEVESDFYRYLSGIVSVSARSRTNYLSWLKFLTKRYDIGVKLTDTDIDDILASEESARRLRSVYTKQSDMSNFKSALRKYRDFLCSDYRYQQEETILAETRKVEADNTISNTEKIAIIRARVGQGLFREKLILYWNGCSISSFKFYDMLIASHIKPWKLSDNRQRLDVYNGLLLLPNYDKLFDRGYISFADSGKIIFSTFFPQSDRLLLGLNDDIRLSKVAEPHHQYLSYHRDNCLLH